MTWKKLLCSVFVTALLAGSLVACDREGPAERAGRSVDEGVDRAGEELERAGEGAERATER